MTEQLSFNNFGFIGFGLIGGSIAHALKEIYPSSNIIAYNYYKIKTHKKRPPAQGAGSLTVLPAPFQTQQGYRAPA